MRPSSSGIVNPSGLVDKRLQPMWTHIEQVRELLPQIAHVSYYLESIFNLDRNLTLLADENVDHHILKDIQIFQGANAYEIALAEGYVGDVTSWLASLVGPKGDTGLLDTAAHQALIDGIAANVAAAAAAQATADAASSNFTNYVPLATYNTRVAAVDAVLADLETTITDVVIPLLPIVRSDTDIGDIAQAKIDTALISVNNALTTVNATLDQYEIDILSLSTEHSATSTAFGEFLVDYGDTLAAITLLTASYNDHETSIVAIQSASALAASNIITLQANDATFSSQITSLQLAEADAATQINVLQTANNDNYAAILSEQTVRISDIAAAAADRALIRTEFASADSGVLSSATALVDAETTARTTAIDAAAADRSLIRTEFASADSGVLSSATALIDAESTARTTALAAAASDRTLIRTEFSDADDAVAAAAAALVSAESSARSTAISAEAAARETVAANLGTLSGVVDNVAQAYATNAGATARLLWQVITGTNVASIVQSAATGYSDGTWNGSAITLTADLITFLAQDINFGSNTTFEDTYDTFYVTGSGYRFRWGDQFGASGDLFIWIGPTSVGLNSETFANGIFAFSSADGLNVSIPLSGATVSPSSRSEFSGATSGYFADYTISAVNGDGTYTYSTAIVSDPDGKFSVSDATTDTPRINWAGITDDHSFVARCTVTETSTGKQAQIDFYGRIIYIAPP